MVSIPSWLLIFFIVLIFVIIGVLIWVVITLRNIQHPKFGFGGKPLVYLGIILLFGVLPIAILAFKQKVDVIQKAAQLNDVSIVWFEVSDHIETSDVAFSATPIIEGKAWGQKKFDIEWEIVGPQYNSFKEEERSSEYPSYFVITLKKGIYEVIVRVRSEGFDITKSITISVD